MYQWYESFENPVGKGEIAHYEQFSVFSTHLDTSLPFLSNSKLLSENSFSLEEYKCLSFGKGLTNNKIVDWTKLKPIAHNIFNGICLWKDMSPITLKGTLWELWKVLTLVNLRSPRSLTTVKTFRYWQIFCVLSDNTI